jgi:hypothetical protein
VAVSRSGNAAYSTDSETWTAVSDTKFGARRINGIAYGDGRFVAVGLYDKIVYSNAQE